MQLSYPISAYKDVVVKAFCELLLGIDYASDLPNLDRFTKFLTRVKENEFDSGNPIPGLTTTDLCKKGLPVNWTFAQFNRGPLMIVDEDEFRLEKLRCFTDETQACFSQEDFGFGKVELNFWMVGNNGNAIEGAEALFYMRLYKLKSIDYIYLGLPWHSRIIHEDLQTFEPLGINEYGTGFTITWRVEMFVPVLRREIEGYTVQEVCTEVYPANIICPPVWPRPLDEEEWPESSREAARQDGPIDTVCMSDVDGDGEVLITRLPDGLPEEP